MVRALTFLVAIATLGLPVAQATTWYVDVGGCPGPGTGTQTDPFCKIQDAVTSADDGDTILVRPGSYDENIVITGKAVFLMRDPTGPRPVINGGNTGSVIELSNSDSTISGFVITGGYAATGGGIYSVDSSPFITDNVIETNVAVSYGGGIYTIHGSPTILGNIIRDNVAGPDPASGSTPLGGGLMIFDAAGATIDSNQILGNTLQADSGHTCYGAGLSAQFGTADLTNNLIAGNEIHADSPALSGGGGLAFGRGGTFTVDFRTIVLNTAGGEGGGITSGDAVASLTVTDSIVYLNNAPTDSSIADHVGNCIVFYSDIEGGWSGSRSGNFDLDPLFVDVTANDFHLSQPLCQPAQSACVDAGDPQVSPPLGTTASCELLDQGDPDLRVHDRYHARLAARLRVMR